MLPKDLDKIQEPEVLPEDYYKFRIVEEPTVEPNKRMKEGGADAPGAGNNLILNLRVVSETPEHNGRPFKKWLSLPTEADKTDITAMGQTKEDFKMSMLAKIQQGFSGVSAEGNELTFEAGQEAYCYVTQGLDQSGTRMINELDFLNSEVKPVAEY